MIKKREKHHSSSFVAFSSVDFSSRALNFHKSLHLCLRLSYDLGLRSHPLFPFSVVIESTRVVSNISFISLAREPPQPKYTLSSRAGTKVNPCSAGTQMGCDEMRSILGGVLARSVRVELLGATTAIPVTC